MKLPLRARDNLVAIVGHGPSLDGAGMGPLIDRHDVVVRMSNCGWQRAHAGDYGRRYDVGIYCPDQPFLIGDAEPLPAGFWLRYRPFAMSGKIEDDRCPARSEFRGRDAYRIDDEVGAELPPDAFHFSKGTAAAIVMLAQESVREVSLFGLDKVLRGHGGTYHHPPALEVAHPIVAEYDRHPWELEGATLRRIAEDEGKGLAWCG